MSKCDLQIVFDRANRTFRPGEEVSGTVHVRVNRDVRCDGLVIEHFWQTHGSGNTATGPKQTNVVFQGDWRAGEAFSYPFRFPVPDGPPTYHGHHLNVDHYIHARVDVPWAIDPRHKEEYLLLPGQREHGNLSPAHHRQHKNKQQILKLGLPVGLAMILAGLLCFPFGLLLIPIALIVLFASLRKSLAEKRIGKVELRWGSLCVAPGGQVHLGLSFTPRKSTTLHGITAKLAAVEQCVSGSGTNKTTHTHKVHEHTVTLAGQGQLVAGEPIQLDTAVPIPQTNAFSFSASDNNLTWSVEVRIDVPIWPDWTQTRVLTLRPVLAAEVVEKGPDPPPLPPLDPWQPATEPETTAALPAEAPTFDAEDPEPAGLQTPIEGVSDATPAAAEPPRPARRPAVDSVLKEVVSRLGSASRYGSERDQIIREYAHESLPCSIEIDGIERTYSFDAEERFGNGRTVTGVLGGTDCEVSLLLPEQRNEELDSLGPGDTLRAVCRLIKWNNIYDRLEIREA